MRILILVLAFCGLFAVGLARPMPRYCDISNPEVAARHTTHLTRLNQPDELWILNTTYFSNDQPGITTFSPIIGANDVTYQFNTFDGNLAGCYVEWLKVDERAPGIWGFGTWIGKFIRPQFMITPGSGQGAEPLRAAYKVEVVEPAFFEQLGALTLQIESRNIATFAETTVFNAILPDGSEFTALTETLSPTPRSIFSGVFDEYTYINGFLAGDANGYTSIDTIHSPRIKCGDYPPESQEARACAARDQFLAGNAELRPDPVAVAAGVTDHLIWSYIEPSAPSAKAVPYNWPQNSHARMTYDMLMKGQIEQYPNGVDYVPGMPKSEEEHNALRDALTAASDE